MWPMVWGRSFATLAGSLLRMTKGGGEVLPLSRERERGLGG